MTPATRRRAAALVAAVVSVGMGLGIHLLAPDTAASDVAGDLLYPLLVYALVVLVGPRLPAVAVSAVTLGWCVAVEAFQVTGLPAEWAAAFPPVVLVFGTVFDPRDIAVYAVAAIGAGLVDAFTRPRREDWG
ncbi:DUF2809 domain-containing protein [Microbacterium caowuchunii]|uniref:DUF2809 domain-containing protein n=1 Tax=Microbacterium caowuchunii TaxID=2614638 RepID=UPI001EE96E35|nr:DUF2809 domain-containing protein [Microbacterium caowuchunii]